MNIHKALITVMNEMTPIDKEGRNDHFRYNFRGIDQVYQTLHPLLRKQGVYMTSEILEKDISFKDTNKGVSCTAIIKVRYTFRHHDGTSVSTEVLGMGADNGDKATNKALAGAHKYALLQAFLIPCKGIEDQDGDSFEYGHTNRRQRAQNQAKTTPPPPPPAVEPKPDMTARYNPENKQHKIYLKQACSHLGELNQDELRAISKACARDKVTLNKLPKVAEFEYSYIKQQKERTTR